MKIAIIGSRSLTVGDLARYLPPDVTEIVSGGARGIDACAREYAQRSGLKLTEFRPDYARYGRRAPLVRNLQIIDYADAVLAFWDGVSHGTAYVIRECRARGKDIRVFRVKTDPPPDAENPAEPPLPDDPPPPDGPV